MVDFVSANKVLIIKSLGFMSRIICSKRVFEMPLASFNSGFRVFFVYHKMPGKRALIAKRIGTWKDR